MSRYTQTMVALLLDERARGEVNFDRAWRHARYRAAQQGVRRPADFYRADDADDDPGWMPFSAFFYEACRREWEGRPCADLRGLPGMLEDSGLSVSSAPDRTFGGDPRVRLVA